MIIDVTVEDFELTDADGFWFAVAPELQVEIEVEDKDDWRIVGISLIGQKGQIKKAIKTFNGSKTPTDFQRLKFDLHETREAYLQSCVSQHLSECRSSRAANEADRRRNANLHEMA